MSRLVFKNSACETKRDIQEIEVWIKMMTGKRRIDITERVVGNR